MTTNRYYIDPKDLTPEQVHAIQILAARKGRPSPVTDGVVHGGRASFRLKTAMELADLGVVYRTETDLGECYVLSKVGNAIAPRITYWRVD